MRSEICPRWTAEHGLKQTGQSRLPSEPENEKTSLLTDYVGTYTLYEPFDDMYGGGL